MNKLLFISVITIICIAALILAVLVFIRASSPPKETMTPSPTPVVVRPTIPTSSTIESSGVQINNPYRDSKEVTTQGDALTQHTETYSIVYLKQFDEFLITINTEPFEGNRQLAENAFLARLGIDKTDACKLKVYVSPPRKEGELTPRFRLSFCDE